MRFREFRLVETVLREGARIDHAEDIVFREGSKGAIRTLNSFLNLEKGGHTDVTIKWDGSPAIIFGRGEDGTFVLTDKSGWVAKGYDGKSKSAKELQKMLMNRPGANNPDPAKRDNYRNFAANMADIYDEYEKAVPRDFTGFFKGDLLYYNTPELEDNYYVFTPNIVTYKIKKDSEIGSRVGRSKTGVVIHRMIDEQGDESPITINVNDVFIGNEVLVFPPVTVQQPPDIDNSKATKLKQTISKNATVLDAMLDMNTLVEKKMKYFPDVLYSYTNSKVDTGLANLGKDFLQWLKMSKNPPAKQAKIVDHIQQNQQGFNALWDIMRGIMEFKDDIINQLNNQDTDVKASIGPHGPTSPDTHGEGGEGYVLAHPKGDIKLVSREYFTKANRSVER